MDAAKLGVLPDLVRWAAPEYGDAPALGNVSEPGATITYNGLCARMVTGAEMIGSASLLKGEPVLLLLEARPEWAVGFFSILQAGLVAVPLAAETPPRSIAAVVAHTGCRAALCSPSTERLLAEAGAIRRIHLTDRVARPSRPAQSVPHKAELDENDVALLVYTSGSTQNPKAVELTHRNILSNLKAVLAQRQERPGKTMLSMLPPAHMFEMMGGLLCPLARGARVVYAGSLLPNRIVDALREQKVTHALAVPSLVDCIYREVLSQLLEAGLVAHEREAEPLAQIARRLRQELSPEKMQELRRDVRQRIGGTFETLTVGGAAIDPDLADLVAALGIRVEVGYGLTEASPVVTFGVVGDCPAGSVGRPLAGVEVRLVDDGEILVRGPNVMRGYYKDAKATAETMRDGWLSTGDCGQLDAGGYLFIKGRLKEAIVTAAGRTVYPEEVEPYYRHPLFAEFCAAGLRGEFGNDMPALLVLAADASVTDEELQAAFRQLRAAAPTPFRLELLVRVKERFPRTASGKIRRRMLAASVR